MRKLIRNIREENIFNLDNHSFFGYYGKSPWNIDNKFFIGLEINFIDRHPTSEDFINIILKNLKNNRQEIIAKTSSWNWQQGAMLQWMPPKFDKQIIFNDQKNGKFVSRIFDIKKKKEKIVNYPIYDIHPSGEFASGISFEKLNNVRKGYGYEGGKEIDGGIEDNEGIYLIDLKNNTKKTIITINDLCKNRPLDSMNYGKHWIDQPVFSPNGKRICFMHRWEIEGGLFHSRFFTIDIDGKNLFMFPDSGFYSHFTWRNSKDILMFCSVSKKLAGIRSGDKFINKIINKARPIYRKIIPRSIRKKVLPIGYYLLKDQSEENKKINIYDDDGHPSFNKDGRFVITDTYPNNKNYRKLILYDWYKQKKIVLGKFYALPDKKYLETTKTNSEYRRWGHCSFRVDLHPRWNMEGDKVCFDSIHEGKRGIYTIDLKNSKLLK